MNWDGNNTSYLQLPQGKQQASLEQFSINDTTDMRLCHRCGEEGHIRKFCNMNIHCDFCKSYSHHTSVCRSYANFVRAHPMVSSRRTSPAQINRQPEQTQHPVEETNADDTKSYNVQETGNKRQISEIMRKHLEQVISTMILSSTCNAIDTVDGDPANSLALQSSYKEMEEQKLKHTPKIKEKRTIVNNYYISDKEGGWKPLREGEILPNRSELASGRTPSKISPNRTMHNQKTCQKENA